ncbi:MAG: hypothetical protein N3E37_00495 [Candidatus Micrarchaeota archaeon]|nr:hypothetical protein [Candidatus Micrarchaeota archaeon]
MDISISIIILAAYLLVLLYNIKIKSEEPNNIKKYAFLLFLSIIICLILNIDPLGSIMFSFLIFSLTKRSFDYFVVVSIIILALIYADNLFIAILTEIYTYKIDDLIKSTLVPFIVYAFFPKALKEKEL